MGKLKMGFGKRHALQFYILDNMNMVWPHSLITDS